MTNLGNRSDKELLELFAENDTAVFREIYNRYWYKLFVFANKRIRDKESSEEIIQTFFTKFWLTRSKINVTGSLESYLFSAVRYTTIDFIEKQATLRKYHQLAYFDREDLDNSTEETVLLNDMQLNVSQEVERLPVKCRSVFKMSRFEHKSNKEIANLLGITEKTVENHITNAIKQLRLNIKNSFLLLLLYLPFLR